MNPVSHETLLGKLSWRYATKVFDPSRKIASHDWATLEAAMVLAPSSYGLQPWKFVVVTDQKVKDRLPEAAWNQSQPKDCSHFVIIAARRTTDPAFVQKLVSSIASERGQALTTLDGLKAAILSKTEAAPNSHLHWNSNQCYIALGFLLETAALLGIDACPMEGIVADRMDEILSLKGGDYTAVVGCALGYRDPSDRYAALKKVRYSAADVVQHI